MNNETQKVDVLAVMSDAARDYAEMDMPTIAEAMRDSRTAVSELIEAVKVYRNAETCQCEYCARRRSRIDAALARIGGAA